MVDLERLAALRTAVLELSDKGAEPPAIASAKGQAITDAVIVLLAACHEAARELGGEPTLMEATRIALEGLRAARTPQEVAKALDVRITCRGSSAADGSNREGGISWGC
jgi:hypothetical protein